MAYKSGMSRSRLNKRTRLEITRKISREKHATTNRTPRKRTATGAPRCEHYGGRNEILARMGFSTYRDYLASRLYRSIRERAFREYGHACEVCGLYANQLHHSDYDEDTLKGLNISGLVPLCEFHHEFIEITRSGKKRTLKDANRLLEILCRKK